MERAKDGRAVAYPLSASRLSDLSRLKGALVVQDVPSNPFGSSFGPLGNPFGPMAKFLGFANG